MNRSAIPVVYGEVLFDKFPDGSMVPGGAPFNVAWHLQAFGMQPLFISRVGDDALGRNIRAMMQDWDLSTAGLQLDSQRPTGTVEVTIQEGEPGFDIVNDRAYDHIDAGSIPPVETALIYHGTLILRNACSANSLTWLRDKYRKPVFVDVNLRPPWWNHNRVIDTLYQVNCVKLNETELDLLMDREQQLEQKAQDFLREREISRLIVTRGDKGAVSFDSTGSSCAINPASGTVDVTDTVGAGDAFSSIVILGILRGWPVHTTMERAQQFASAIVGIRGAVVNDRKFYQPFIKHWKIFES